jgi:hypothetical protein
MGATLKMTQCKSWLIGSRGKNIPISIMSRDLQDFTKGTGYSRSLDMIKDEHIFQV